MLSWEAVGVCGLAKVMPKTTKSPEESLSILNGVFPVLFAGRWWVSAFGAPSIGREKGIERTCGMDAKKK